MQQALPDVPAWIYPLAAFAAAFVGYLAKLGFDKGKAEKPFPEKATQVGAVVVDSKTLSELVAAIEGGTFELITKRKADDDRETRMLRAVEGECTRVVRSFEKLTDEVERLSREVDRHADKIASRH